MATSRYEYCRAVRSVLMLVAALAMYAQVTADGRTVSTPARGAWLESADGRIIGSVTGHGLAQDERRTMLGAYGVLSTRGYFAEVLPSSELAQVATLVYGEPGCAGPPAIEVKSADGRTAPVPGYVFAFGSPARTWQVPAAARVGVCAIASRLVRNATGYRCQAVTLQTMVYTLVANRSELSGIASTYVAPLRLRQLRNL